MELRLVIVAILTSVIAAGTSLVSQLIFDNERSEVGRPFQAADSVSTESTGQKAGTQGTSPYPRGTVKYYPGHHTGSRPRPWAVYYSDSARPEEFRGYDLVVFDADSHPPLQPISATGSIVLGYLSLCEVEQHRSWFGQVKESGLLAGENPDWPGSYFIDVRDARWRKLVVSQLVPAVIAQGFQGIFLDTTDDAAELERRDPKKFAGMKAATIQLVNEIHTAIPAATLMVNRGYDLLPAIAASINIVLGESVYGTYDSATKRYHRVPEAQYREQVALLAKVKSINPSLRICTLDYWNPSDRNGIRRVYREERSHGFDPYVATISLDQLIREPQ